MVTDREVCPLNVTVVVVAPIPRVKFETLMPMLLPGKPVVASRLVTDGGAIWKQPFCALLHSVCVSYASELISWL